MFVTVKRAVYGEDHRFKFCGRTPPEVLHEKTTPVMASDQTKLSVSRILNVSMSIE